MRPVSLVLAIISVVLICIGCYQVLIKPTWEPIDFLILSFGSVFFSSLFFKMSE